MGSAQKRTSRPGPTPERLLSAAISAYLSNRHRVRQTLAVNGSHRIRNRAVNARLVCPSDNEVPPVNIPTHLIRSTLDPVVERLHTRFCVQIEVLVADCHLGALRNPNQHRSDHRGTHHYIFDLLVHDQLLQEFV
jgi:hypothetical protein